ncbi:MAG: ABC transporter ATP-binding protein [Rhodospirillum sp.]|nr:ABC transporter ATP-binding protein [Rhodospirillum sp.]MCF8490112.1 ABC transporter ATP-binding protein [Rhodospirillum sp.]MCF8501130.1 ABC transporter ATP-binding protein [Rhodospirillum sp.]
MITVTNLGHRFPNAPTWTFRNLSLTLPEGEVLAILGPNGRGKTTLLKCMLGLRRPGEGTIRILGAHGYVPQSFSSTFTYGVLETVVMGRARHLGLLRSPGAEDYAIARRALDRLEIGALANRNSGDLSGGQRQMVMIARALASDCRVLFLDEPTSALDFHNQDRVLSVLRGVARESGLTVVFTSHYPQHALHVADKALALHGETDHAFGPVSDVLDEPALTRLYGLPMRRARVRHGGRVMPTVIPVYSPV